MFEKKPARRHRYKKRLFTAGNKAVFIFLLTFFVFTACIISNLAMNFCTSVCYLIIYFLSACVLLLILFLVFFEFTAKFITIPGENVSKKKVLCSVLKRSFMVFLILNEDLLSSVDPLQFFFLLWSSSSRSWRC